MEAILGSSVEIHCYVNVLAVTTQQAAAAGGDSCHLAVYVVATETRTAQ